MKLSGKILALLLAILMVVGTLCMVACGDEKDDGGKDQGQEQGQTGEKDQPGENTPSGEQDKPDDKEPSGDVTPDEPDDSSDTEVEKAKLQKLFDDYDFGGTTVNLLSRDTWTLDPDKGPVTGDVVQQAIWSRQLAVEENLGITFNLIENDGSSDINTKLTNDVTSNTGDVHIIDGHMKFNANAALTGQCLNLGRLKAQLDLTKDYWNQSYTEKWHYKNMWCWTTGDVTHGFLSIMVACFVNGDYWNEYFPSTDIYALVENNQWTLEKAAEIVSQFGYIEQDGVDGPSQDDTFAWVAQNGWSVSSLAYGAGYSMTVKEGQKYTLDMASAEKETLYSKLLALSQQNGFIKLTNGEDRQPLQNGLCLITHERLYRMEQFRTMTTPFYVVPLPKESEEADYHTPSYDGVPVVGVGSAIAANMYDVIGATLEAMAILGKQDLTIAYYENALQSKYARDEGSFRSLEIIRASGWCDFGFAWCQYINGIDTIVGDAMLDGTASISQKDAVYGEQYTKGIKTLYGLLKKLSDGEEG